MAGVDLCNWVEYRQKGLLFCQSKSQYACVTYPLDSSKIARATWSSDFLRVLAAL